MLLPVRACCLAFGRLQVAREILDVGPASLEQTQVMFAALAHVLAQVQLVRFAGQAAVAGQEPG